MSFGLLRLTTGSNFCVGKSKKFGMVMGCLIVSVCFISLYGGIKLPLGWMAAAPKFECNLGTTATFGYIIIGDGKKRVNKPLFMALGAAYLSYSGERKLTCAFMVGVIAELEGFIF